MIVDRALRRSKRSFNATWDGTISLIAQLGVSGEYIASGGTSQFTINKFSDDVFNSAVPQYPRDTESNWGQISKISHKVQTWMFGVQAKKKEGELPHPHSHHID